MKWEKLNLNVKRLRQTPGRKGGIFGPGKRWGHTCNSVKGGKFLYVFGGYSKETCQTNEVHVYDTTRKAWSKPMVKGNPPTPRDSHSCTTVGNNLFVFGGTDGSDPLGDLHILDTSSNTWISPSIRGEEPHAREGHSAAAIGKQLFIFGGCGQNNSNEVCYNDLYTLDTETLEWKCTLASGTPPSARHSHTCSTWKHNVVVVAGVDTSGHYLCDVHILDTDTLVWRELHTSGHSLLPRAGHSSVVLGSNLFVLGGFTDNRNLYDDLHMLNLETGIWTKVVAVDQGPSARFSVAGDCLDALKGVLVFVGGCNEHLEASDDMYYLQTELSVENEPDEPGPKKSSHKREAKRKSQEQCVPGPVSLPASDSDVHNLETVPDVSQIALSPVPSPEGSTCSGLSRKRGRGPSQGKLSESDGRKKILSTNEYGIPNGEDADHNSFMSTIGVLTRSNIPIIYKSFRAVPEEYKQKVLDTLSKSYEFEGIGGIGVDFVRYCINQDWKSYKNTLHLKYIKDQDPTIVKEGPPPHGVTMEHWKMFVDYCNSPEFKALSARNKANRGKQIASATLGRRSMAVVRHKMAKEKNLMFDSEVSRAEVYIKAHTKKDGTLLCPKIVSNIQEIESLDPDSRFLSADDSLTKALGKDSRGRMRGLGGCISRTLVKKARQMVRKNEAVLEEKIALSNDVWELKQGYQQLTKTVEELKAMVMAKEQKGTIVDTPGPTIPSGQASSSDLTIIGKQCTLYGWARRLVGHGLVHATDPNLIVHGKPMGEGHFEIALTEVVDSTCLLWMPDGFHDNVGEVGVGGFVVWPQHSVEINS